MLRTYSRLIGADEECGNGAGEWSLISEMWPQGPQPAFRDKASGNQFITDYARLSRVPPSDLRLVPFRRVAS
jgi:hypothetical protein